MPIRVACPSCGHVLKAPDAAAGKRGKCGKCGAAVLIPATSDTPPAPVPPAAAPPVSAPAPVIPDAIPVPPPAPAAEAFDVDIEDDIEPLPPPPPSPVKPVTVVAVVPAPGAPAPVVVAVAPVTPAAPQVDASNPFADFAPPDDSVAARLSDAVAAPTAVAFTPDAVESPTASSEPAGDSSPLHPGWRDVGDGLGWIQKSIFAGFLLVLVVAAAMVVGAYKPNMALYALIPVLLLSFVPGLLLLLGLLKCLKMPQPEAGGVGRNLALYSLILFAVGLFLPCANMLIIAVPFLLGLFLRGIGAELRDTTAFKLATRYLIAATGAVLFGGMVPMLAIGAILMMGPDTKPETALIISLGASVVMTGVNVLALVMFLFAVNASQKAIAHAVKVRGVDESLAPVAPASRSRGKRQPARVEADEPESEAPAPAKPSKPAKPSSRRKKPPTSSDDDYNPFA